MEKQEFKNPETRAKYRFTGSNMDVIVQIPNVWMGKLENLPPHAAQALIDQGRTNIVPIAAEQPASVNAVQPETVIEELPASKRNVPKPLDPK